MYRYLGNKTAILEPLLEVISKNAPPGSRFLDAMCGTASVSSALAEAGHVVTAADILTFPGYHAEVRLRMSDSPDFHSLGGDYGSVLNELNNVEGLNGYFWNEYSEGGHPLNASKPRLYFTSENASKIDAMDQQIKFWKNEGRLSEGEWILLRHDLIMAVNRVANIAGTYGHFRSSFTKASFAKLSLKPTVFNEWASTNNRVIRGAAEEIAPYQDVDVIYLDPPYTKRQYSANYHLLETLAVGDNPDPIGESGLRDWWPQYSDFCSKRKIRQAFRAVLGAGNYSTAFVSYSEDGLLQSEEMQSLLQEFGEVRIHTISHKRFKSNQSLLSQSLSEYVFEVKRK
jgi:adenine-specific DNA-methyltransferase